MRLLRLACLGLTLAGSSLCLGGWDEKPAKKEAKSEAVVGCSDTKQFHKPGCKWVKEIEKAGTKVNFASKADAEKKGYKACGDCKP